MNIFYLDTDARRAAQMHCDKHVVKMVVEYAQMLSTAHRVLDGDTAPDACYKIAHKNHPCTIWTRASKANYAWLYSLFVNTAWEYRYRYIREHATWKKLGEVLRKVPQNIPDGPLTEVPQAMPDHCKMNNAVDAYRNYYILEKAGFAKWSSRSVPDWFVEAV